jgi:hypothetical protein
MAARLSSSPGPLAARSPAFDAGEDCTELAGRAMTLRDTCDLGAFEVP